MELIKEVDNENDKEKDKDKDKDNELKTKIRNAFDLFDKDKKGFVMQEEVSTIMRYLGAFPTEKDIVKKILPEMQDDQLNGFISFDQFEKVMLSIIKANEYLPDTDDNLMMAFRVLDPENKGYIDSQVMRELLVTKGTPFREKELESFLSVAKDMETGRIYYEDYISLLKYDTI